MFQESHAFSKAIWNCIKIRSNNQLHCICCRLFVTSKSNKPYTYHLNNKMAAIYYYTQCLSIKNYRLFTSRIAHPYLTQSNFWAVYYLHSPLHLWSNFLVHFDQTTAVVHKHTIMGSILQVYTKNKVQKFGVLESSTRLHEL